MLQKNVSASALACVVGVLLATASARAATITVSSAGDVSADDGQCTFREAIIAANTNTPSGAMAGECATGVAGLDTIAFDIAGGGVHTIDPVSVLPAISQAVTIDGYTQPLASPNTNPLGAAINAVLLIELNQTQIGGLQINAAGSTIRGLVLNRGIDEIRVAANDVTIAGSFIGANPSGTVGMPAVGGGLAIRQTSGNGTLIGGPTAADRNLISGDGGGGIVVQAGDGTRIEGNYLGPDVTGTVALNASSQPVGIYVLDGATNTVVSRNLISGNGGGGVDVRSSGGGVIEGNLIGTQRDGVGALGNGNFGGINLAGSDFLVGGTGPGQGNTIAFNPTQGIGVPASSTGNAIIGNAIFANSGGSNSGLGVNLRGTVFIGPLPNDGPCDPDTSAGNLGQNYPVITSAPVAAGTVTISGTLGSTASTAFRIELFANASCDPLGNGEGQTFLGFVDVSTDETCAASFGPLVFPVPPGQTIFTATATDAADNTSEFSACFPTGVPTTSTSTTVSTTTTTTTTTTTVAPVTTTTTSTTATTTATIASTTSTSSSSTTTSFVTTSTTLPSACPAGSTYESIECRLLALLADVTEAPDLGKLQPGLTRTLVKARDRLQQVPAAPTARRAKGLLRKLERKLVGFAHRVRSKRGRDVIPAATRDRLATDQADPLRIDVLVFRDTYTMASKVTRERACRGCLRGVHTAFGALAPARARGMANPNTA